MDYIQENTEVILLIKLTILNIYQYAEKVIIGILFHALYI